MGGGLVGTELLGELSAFAHEIVEFYPCVRRSELRFLLFEHSQTLGVMAALGGHEGVTRILWLRGHGFLAWWLRRTYALLQTPGLERKLRIIVDWTVALFLRPDVVKLDTAGERALLLRSGPAGAGALPVASGETVPARLLTPPADRAPAPA